MYPDCTCGQVDHEVAAEWITDTWPLKISIFLAKPGVGEADLIEQKKGLTKTPISLGRRRIGILYSVPCSGSFVDPRYHAATW
jgi:hypothetical protein